MQPLLLWVQNNKVKVGVTHIAALTIYAQVMAVGYLEPYLTSSFCAFLFIVSLTHAPDVNFFYTKQCWWTNWGQGLYPQIRKIFICIPFVSSCVQHCAVPYTLCKAEDKRINWSMTTLLRSTPAPTPALITGIFTAFHPVDSVHLLSKALCSFLFFAQIWASSELNFPVGHC